MTGGEERVGREQSAEQPGKHLDKETHRVSLEAVGAELRPKVPHHHSVIGTAGHQLLQCRRKAQRRHMVGVAPERPEHHTATKTNNQTNV